MAYTKQTFTAGQTLKASDLNTMSQGIKDLDDGKQAKLVSGINIKTINGVSLLGDGDIEIKGNSTSGGDAQDILIGTLPQTIDKDFCYIISPTNATISTGEGVPNLLDLNEQVPYIANAQYSDATWEVLGKTTIKVIANGTTRNLTVDIPIPELTVGDSYTVLAKLTDCSEDAKSLTKVPGVRVINGGTYHGLSVTKDGKIAYKSFTCDGTEKNISIVVSKQDGVTVGSTYWTLTLYFYQGVLTDLPTGATFDILATEKYNVDGYKGATLEAVNGETVYLYQIDTSNSEVETDNGGVIFFGDSILDHSGLPALYSKRTGKPVIDCAVGGTRMSDSREEGNDYKPYDMASIANAIGTNNYTALIDGGKNSAFTVLSTANIGGYKAIVLEFGTNDYSAKVPFHGEGTDSIEGALKFILRTLITKYPNIRIVVLSTLQYITLGTGNESGVPKHDDGTVWEMNEMIKDICESDEFCVPFVDMYHRFGQNAITRNVLNSDGVHLTPPNGVQRYLDILVAQLNDLGI